MDWELEYLTYSNGQEMGIQTMEMLTEAHKQSRDPVKAQLLDYWNCRADNLGNLLSMTAMTASVA